MVQKPCLFRKLPEACKPLCLSGLRVGDLELELGTQRNGGAATCWLRSAAALAAGPAGFIAPAALLALAPPPTKLLLPGESYKAHSRAGLWTHASARWAGAERRSFSGQPAAAARWRGTVRAADGTNDTTGVVCVVDTA